MLSFGDRGETMAVRADIAVPKRASIWPLFAVPILAPLYYMFVQDAFVRSASSVVGTPLPDFAFTDLEWGTHWAFRLAAEFVTIGLATFVAAGISRGRAHQGALIGAGTISLFYVVKTVLFFLVLSHPSPDYDLREPWYQHVIDAGVIVAAPIIAWNVAEPACDIHDEYPGFGGIARWHFAWLWIAAYLYALGLIGPLSHVWMAGADRGIITTFVILLFHGIPAAALLIPAYYGLALLGAHKGTLLHPVARNIFGMLVLIVGFAVGRRSSTAGSLSQKRFLDNGRGRPREPRSGRGIDAAQLRQRL